jgi:hypothetical protein
VPKIAKIFTAPLDVADIEKIKAVASPIVPTNEIAVAMFVEKLMEQQKGKSLTTDSMTLLLDWFTEIPNVDSSLFWLLKRLFNRVNSITGTIPTFNLIGLQALWNLLFECGLPDACEFVVDLVSRCQSPKAITTFIEECLARLESVGALILSVIRIEFPLDAKDPRLLLAARP